MAPRTLVVDDEPKILGTVAPLLRSRGYEVHTAMTGRAAIRRIARENPDPNRLSAEISSSTGSGFASSGAAKKFA